HAQAVELLGGLHRADLGGDRRAGASGREKRRQHGTKLADQAQADDRAERVFRAEAHQRRVALQAQHHADGDARDADDQDRQHADLEQLVEELAQPERRAKRDTQDVRGERGDAAELAGDAVGAAADARNARDHGCVPWRSGLLSPCSNSATLAKTASESSVSSVRKRRTRGSAAPDSSAGDPAITPSGSSSTTWSAMRMVDGM